MSIYLPFLLAGALLFASLIFYFVLKGRVKGHLFSSHQATVTKKDTEVNRISQADFNACLSKLESYVEELKPSLIVGVNRGGMLTAAYIAKLLDVSEQKLLWCSVPVIDGKSCSVHENRFVNKTISGKILVVDDVCRTGTTIEAAVNFLKERYDIDGDIYTAALASVEFGDTKLDYPLSSYGYKTKYPDIRMPWHRKDDPYMLRAVQANGVLLEERRVMEFNDLSNKSRDELSDLAGKAVAVYPPPISELKIGNR